LKSIPPMDPMTTFLLNADQQFVHNILTGYPFNCTLYFFDYRSATFGSYFDIIGRIISHIAGIILFHHQHEGQRHVLVVTKRSHTEPHAQYIVPAEFPPKSIPPIMELLAPDSNKPDALLPQKLELLAWVCSDNLPFASFAALPASLMITIMTLFRLTECGALSLFEADLLLWIAHELSIDRFDPSAERRPYRLDPRAFRIGFLFQKVYAHCARAAKALGLPRKYRPSTPFDGLRFHNQYSAWQKGEMQHHIQSIVDWRLYSDVARIF
uniref:Uncharacterized protein n=1 Tax=Anopheles atroparvus TaxID=41427 RepID=A0A182IN82_ANOAO